MFRRSVVAPSTLLASGRRTIVSWTRSTGIEREQTRSLLLNSEFDAIVLGGGHNGLVSSAYLAQSGKRVLVLERRSVVGGAAVSEEIHPGYIYSRCSYLYSLFRPEIVRELDLKRHGLRLHKRVPFSSFTPLADGSNYLLLGPNAESNRKEISKFSVRDAEAYEPYEADLEAIVHAMDPLLFSHPAELLDIFRPSSPLYSAASRTLKLLLSSPRRAFLMEKLLRDPAQDILRTRFESEPLLSTLATDAIIGASLSPACPGSGYVLLHHVMGESEGVKGAWAYVEGGMGALSNAIASAAKSSGAHILVDAPVARIRTTDGDDKRPAVCGVELEDGTFVRAKAILSNATPDGTFRRLLDPSVIPEEFHARLDSYDYDSPVFKMNVALSRIPDFRAFPLTKEERSAGVGGVQHRGTIHLVDNMKQVEQSFIDMKRDGVPSRRPIIELTIPSSLDRTLVKTPGSHVASLFVQYVPYSPKDGSWDDPVYKQQFVDRCFDVVESYCPGFRESVLHVDALSPLDLEREFGLTGGNIFHGAMSLDQLYWARPSGQFVSQGHAVNFLDGLYLCGSGSHPGGGVMGIAGRNCAQIVLARK